MTKATLCTAEMLSSWERVLEVEVSGVEASVAQPRYRMPAALPTPV